MSTIYNLNTSPRCPRCGKCFPQESSVLRHMNHPQSNCRFFYENVVHFQQPNSEFSSSSLQTSTSKPFDSEEPSQVPMFEDLATNAAFDDVDMEVNQHVDEHEESLFVHPRANAPKYYKETHPNSSWIQHGKGETFMDKFDKDKHAAKRSSNLYYPFSTRSEWELAAFLLRSNLSMASIDEFLKLDLVRFHFFICRKSYKFSHLDQEDWTVIQDCKRSPGKGRDSTFRSPLEISDSTT